MQANIFFGASWGDGQAQIVRNDLGVNLSFGVVTTKMGKFTRITSIIAETF